METNNIDSIFRKTVNESTGYYEFEAEQSKGSIWQQIQSGKKNRTLPVIFRLLAAACILLLFCTTFLAILLSREKKNIRILAEASRIIKTESPLQGSKIQPQNSIVAASHTLTPDTIYINRNVIVYQPLVTTEIQVDTVYVNQVVYREREIIPELISSGPNDNIKESTSPVQVTGYGKEFVISNKQSRNTEKKGKFLFKLGGNNSPAGNGSLAFTVNL